MSSAQSNADLDLQVLDLDARQGERAIEAVYKFLSRFVSYPSEHAHVAHVLWTAHTHLMKVWDSTPRLAFLSAEPASGKTRALEITELLVPNPVATVNVTPAYLFRKVGSEDGATILFDEVDTVFGPKAKDNEDIRGLLNAGHRRGATTGRCVTHGKQVFTEELPAYAAVALAGLGWLPPTILSRSIVIRMRRRHAGEQVEPFRRRIHEADGCRVREQIANWAKSASAKMAWPVFPSQITDRDADVWEALIMVADAAGGTWPGRAREAALALVADAKEVEPSLGIKLLQDMRLVFGEATELSSKSILTALHAIEESPWADLRGKPLDERGIGNRLRQYGIRSRTVRVPTGTIKGYVRTDFVDVWARYAPLAAATSVTSVTSVTEPSGGCSYDQIPGPVVTDVTDVTDIPAGERRCAACHDATGPFCEASINGNTIWLHLHCRDRFRV
jgi:hypothetical protein